jgi:hypothetical protein
VRIGLFLVGIALVLVGLWGSASAFEIQYPGEDGYFIGKPMVYVITADASNDQSLGQEGVFAFGQDRVTIGDEDYYDCLFDSPSGTSHFYLDLDPVNGDLIQKGFKIGSSELIVDPAVVAAHYPLSPGDNWSDETDLDAKNVEIPGLGPLSFSIAGVKAETKVSSSVISVPGGDFDTLLVEATFSGSWLGIPMVLVQRTWLSQDNVPVKRSFEFLKPTELLLYQIELSKLTTTPWDLNWDGVVDISDAVIVAEHFGERILEPMISNPDVDGNGIVDVLDLATVGVHFGESGNSAAPARYIRMISPAARNMLLQSFPNPCNPEVWIPYALAVDSPVMISIYNMSGRLVRELDLGHKPAGIYTSRAAAAHWDGKNRDGEKVANGVYFYTIRAGGFTATRRMLVSR